MGRLFWKFFLSILLAQLTATVGIGGTIWLKNRNQGANPTADLDTGPPAEMAVLSAASTLEFGGTQALANMLAKMERHRVYAVDEQGHELLGRIASPAMLSEARLLLKQKEHRPVVRDIPGSDGKRYLLFLPSPEHQRGLDGSAGPLLPDFADPGFRALQPPRGDRPPGPTPEGQPGTAASRGPHAGDPGRPPPPPDGRGGPRFQPLTPWIPFAAAMLASLLFAVLLAWYFSRPIRALRLAFEAAAGGDLAPRFVNAAGKRNNELNDLGRDFDRMTARLRSLIDGQTRLLHDVSHELRSPLARLQAAIGLAHQQPEKMAASMERIERESVRMDKLVGELLTLARLEAGALNALTEDISMADLLGQIADDASFEAASQKRSVQQQGDADVLVVGQPDLLGRAIENVVRNAIKHSPVDGEVLLQAQANAKYLHIRVLDQGPGVPEAELAEIFRPFFRSSDASTDGHGLGLAIAQHVVEAHHGSIKANNRTSGGLCVEIVLPIARRAA